MTTRTLDRDNAVPDSISPPEPDLTAAELLDRATALIPALRLQAERADELGHYTAEVHEAFCKAGLYRILQPRRFGGYQFGPRVFLEAVHRIAIGHAGSAWCFTLAASHTLLLSSRWPEAVQREFYGKDGHFLAPHRVPPAGEFRRVDGGYIVNGTWTYSSGSAYCTHWAGGAIISEPDGTKRSVNIYVPREHIEILDDWGGDRALGMNASGSNSVRLTDVFVPDAWVGPGDVLFGDQVDYAKGTIGTRLFDDPVYLGVFGGVFHLCFTAMMTGLARATLEQFIADIKERKAFGAPGMKMVDDEDIQSILGQAVTGIECAEAIFHGAIDACVAPFVEWHTSGRPIVPDDTMKVWGMGRQGAKMAVEAIEKMFHFGGVVNANKGFAMQRNFRDAQMYRVHGSSHPWVDAARGQTHLGLLPRKILGRYK